MLEDRTEKTSKQVKKAENSADSNFPGERAGGGYFLFHFKAELNKKHYFKDFGRGRRRVEEVFVEELD